MASISKRVSERLSKESRKFQKVLHGAKDRDINESDTVLIITDMLAQVFGFDKFLEITSEYKVKGTFCDLAVKIDDNVKYLEASVDLNLATFFDNSIEKLIDVVNE